MMYTLAHERNFVLGIESSARASVYLSTSWQPGKGLDISYRLVRSLDEHQVRVVGDARDLPTQEESRIRRIMAPCDGFLCVLPFRPGQPAGTSPYMLEELRLAIDLELPIALLYDARIPLLTSENGGGVSLAFGDARITFTVPVERLVVGPRAYDVDVATSEAKAEAEIVAFRERVVSGHEARSTQVHPPYAFLITRLKGDFELARMAIATAVEAAAGVPCLWIDAVGYTTNVQDTVERTRLLIEYTDFVVADLSFSEENPDFDNPVRAHEVGMAVAFRKKLFLTAQAPRRDPYHALSTAQVVFWDDEADLESRLRGILHDERASVGRHIYNWDLPRPGDSYAPRIKRPEFQPAGKKRHVAPAATELPRAEGWVLAICFALSALAASILLERYARFDDTFDFAAIVGAIFALTFSSDLNRLFRRQLAQSRLLQLSVVALTVVLVVAAAVAPPQTGRGDAARAQKAVTRSLLQPPAPPPRVR